MFNKLKTLFCSSPVVTPSAPLPYTGWFPFPPRFADLKARILPHGRHVIDAWNEILAELADTTEKFNATLQDVGSWYLSRPKL